MAKRINSARAPFSQETLNVLLRYEPETGRLFWRERPLSLCKNERYQRAWNTRCAGSEALKQIIGNGYLGGTIFNRHHYAHRVVWTMVNGPFEGDIDHINGDRTDNRLANLRAVSRSLNLRNTSLRDASQSGHPGVTFDAERKKWMARFVDVIGAERFLGRFDNINDAIAARKAAEAEHDYHPNHGRKPE